MAELREGFRRLSWVVGSMAALVWSGFFTAVAANTTTLPGLFLLGLLLGAGFWFLVAWALTRGVGWVIRGFKGV
jgi:hypothetical protein